MPSLAEELLADQDPRSKCKLCVWLDRLSKTEQREWDAALADRAYTHSSIRRALARRQLTVGDGVVQNHRGHGHRRQPKIERD